MDKFTRVYIGMLIVFGSMFTFIVFMLPKILNTILVVK